MNEGGGDDDLVGGVFVEAGGLESGDRGGDGRGDGEDGEFGSDGGGEDFGEGQFEFYFSELHQLGDFPEGYIAEG